MKMAIISVTLKIHNFLIKYKIPLAIIKIGKALRRIKFSIVELGQEYYYSFLLLSRKTLALKFSIFYNWNLSEDDQNRRLDCPKRE